MPLYSEDSGHLDLERILVKLLCFPGELAIFRNGRAQPDSPYQDLHAAPLLKL